MKEIQCTEVIITTLERRGTGAKSLSPIRKITQVYTKDGDLIAENDPFTGDKFALGDLVHFARHCVKQGLKINEISHDEAEKWASKFEKKTEDES